MRARFAADSMRFLLALAILASCFASSCEASALSLHAAALTPSLSLLTWSAPSPSRWLSLSLDPHSASHLSLPLDAPSHLIVSGALDDADASDSAFTLCEHDNNNSRIGSPSSFSPLCAHAALPALHSSSASATMADTEPRWDLGGARLSAELTRSPVDSSAHRISWSAAHVSTDPAAPPLLYSLFAEWSAHTIDKKQMSAAADSAHTAAAVDSATAAASPPQAQPTLQRHSVRMCTARSDEQQARQQQLHCDVAADHLPRGVELTLHLLTECDYQTINAEGAPILPHCLSAVSPEMRVTLELLQGDAAVIVATSPISFLAAPGVAQVADDAIVREALCVFFNQTSGPQWSLNTGWCDPGVPICGNGTQPRWAAVTCDSTGEVVTGLNFDQMGLTTPSTGADVSPLFEVLNRLEHLLLQEPALYLTHLDLAGLARLQTLVLLALPAISSGAVQTLVLPEPCSLLVVEWTAMPLWVPSWPACPYMTVLKMDTIPAPAPFAIITLMPMLQEFSAPNSAITGDALTAGGLSGGELTSSILSHLNVTNPQLMTLDLTNCLRLPFGLANSSDNWPHVNSPLLSDLQLDGLPLRTGPLGPIDLRWAADMPSLTQLTMQGLPDIVIDLAAMEFASRTLESWSCGSLVIGDLSSLFSLTALNSLDLSGSGLRSTLPQNVSNVWPNLEILACSGCNIHGNLPNFWGLPNLISIALDRNNLDGVIGELFAKDSPSLSELLLSSNLLQGPLPTFCGSQSIAFVAFDANLIETFPPLDCYGYIEQLQLQSNPMRGTIPDRDPSLPTMDQFQAADCFFTKALPRGINAHTVDLSHNNFDGPLILFDSGFVSSMTTLRLASAGRLSCPIQLSALPKLQTLVISGNGFDGCDFLSVALPVHLENLDVSDNSWLSFDLNIPLQLLTLQANRAGIEGVTINANQPPVLQSISLDGARFNPLGNRDGVTVTQQLAWIFCPAGSATLTYFSCIGCGLTLPMSQLMSIVQSNSIIAVVNLATNRLWSDFVSPSGLSTLTSPLPPLIREFSIANNPRVNGRLPHTPDVIPALESLNFAGTGVIGPIPSSWSNLPSLSQLDISNSSLQCDLVVSAQSKLQCAEQAVVSVSSTITIESVSRADPTAGVHCSALTILATGSSSVTADPSSYGFTLCSCDSGSFGLHSRCYTCPEGCTCNDDRILNCFPVVRRGSIAVSPHVDYSNSRAVIDNAVLPFNVSVVLPCPRTVTGASLCNPDGIAWPSFYRIAVEGTASISASLSDSDASSPSDAEIDLINWCYPGHTGRLCAACSSGYFSSGRWCLRCLSEGVHLLILVANLLLIVALIVYLYVKSPSALTASTGLQLYLSRVARPIGLDVASRSMRDLSKDVAGDSDLRSLSIDAALDASTTSDPVNPLKLLIFHSQQLSLLLHTSTSLPPVMAGLLSFMNSGSTGFSLTSLIAMECLSSWTLRERCWMAVFAPALIGLVAGLTALLGRMSGPAAHESHAMQLQGRDQPLLAADSVPDNSSSASIVPRIYSVCVSLLYFLFFPCAQTLLSAVACTDTRESDQSYLNLYPAQACDDEWRRTILPPAVLGLLFWVVAFPLGSTLMLMKFRARVAASSDSRSVSASAATSASSASALSVWPVCSDLLLPYSPRFWFWEQLLLMRRLMLVAAVTIIPSSSLYLPLVLFAIVQLSALQQHWSHPYTHSLLNTGELASLYLLIVSYISAIILQTGLVDGGFHQTANGWAAALFVVNITFLLILVAALFGFVRQRMERRAQTRISQRL